MVRWLLWFLVGAAILVLGNLALTNGDGPLEGAALVLGLLFMAWLGLTAIAVPVAMIRWLLGGSPRRRASVDH